MKKKNLTLLFSFLTGFVSFTLLYFLLPFEKKDFVSHILCYVCFAVFLVVLFLSAVISTKKNNKAEKIALSLPLVKTILAFGIAELVLTIAEFIVNFFVPVPFYVPLIVFLLLISIYSLLIGLKKSNIEHIEQNEVQREQSTGIRKELRQKASLLVNLSEDEVTKTNRQKVFDMLRYSDSVANEKTEKIEKEISTALDGYQSKIKDKKQISDVADVMNRIQERNLLCQRGKR